MTKINNEILRVYSKTVLLAEFMDIISSKGSLSISADTTFGLRCFLEEMALSTIHIKDMIDTAEFCNKVGKDEKTENQTYTGI